MIKSIKVNGVHGVDSSLQFKDHNKLCGQSLLGKTTILNSIIACYSKSYPGYANTFPDGTVELETDAGNVIIKNKKVVGELIQSDIIRYTLPGNFFKLLTSTVKQREVITKILDIDGSELENINEEIKDIKSKIKEFNTKKDQITDDIIRIEGYADSLDEVLEEPEQPEIVEGNTEEINTAYNTMIQKIKDSNELIEEDNRRIKKAAEKYKLEEKIALEMEIQSVIKAKINITDKAGEAKKNFMEYNCSECGTLIKGEDKESVILNLRKEYKDLIEEEAELRNKLQNILFEIDDYTTEALGSLKKTEDYKDDYVLSVKKRAEIMGMEYINSNTDAYDKWAREFKDYQEVINKRESYFAEIKVKEEQLKELNFVQLEKELKTKEKERTNFNTKLEEKVKDTGLDIRLFKTLKNGNIKETFEIYDSEGNMYGATSTGNELFIEVLLSKLFIKYLGIDFILIDRWESIGINLRDKILKELDGLQIIVTEVTKDKEITLKHNL